MAQDDRKPDDYDKTDLMSILRRAARLTGRTLGDFVDSGEVIVGGTRSKGLFGQIVESGYFHIENNSSPLPDFREAGLELKVTPIVKSGARLVSKERLILGIINYEDVPRRRFHIFLDKDSHILIVFYRWRERTDIFRYVFLKVVDWEPTPEELRMIHEDWEVIEGYVMRGEAHLLSERHTKYLAACTKGAGHGGDMRSQPFSAELAKQRALSFKASFMTGIFHSRPDINETLPAKDDSVRISEGWKEGQSFEEHVAGKFSPFIGKTCAEIEGMLGVSLNTSSKQYHSSLSLAMAGATGKRHVAEFDQAGIEMKTIRIGAGGTPKEHMSFPYIRYDDMAEQTWEESDFFSHLDHRFFSPVFSYTKGKSKYQGPKDLVFSGAFFWSVPDADFDAIRGVWEDTKAKVLAGDFNHFVAISDGRIAHVRPHSDKEHYLTTFRGRKVKKMCFWLNAQYIKGIIDRNLKRWSPISRSNPGE
jgi:DNA mismatch repair protein MutH